MRRIAFLGLACAMVALAGTSCSWYLGGLLYELQKTTETRQLGPFTSIKIRGPGELSIHAGEQKVAISAKKDAIGSISTTIVGTTLVIAVPDGATDTESNYYDITMPSLIGIEAEGSCMVALQSAFSGENLTCRLSDSSSLEGYQINYNSVNIECNDCSHFGANIISGSFACTYKSSVSSFLEGNSNEAIFDVSGEGSIGLGNLLSPYQASKCTCEISGSGSLFVLPSVTLEGAISGAGNIQYWGNPSVSVVVTGAGQPIKN